MSETPEPEVRVSGPPGHVGFTPWGVIEVLAVVVVLGAFLLQVRAVLNPLVLLVLLWVVMRPYRGRPGHGALLTVASLLAFVWLLASTDTLLAPFVLGLVLAYVLDPLADRIQARGVSRALAVMAIIVPAVAALAVVFVFVLPAVIAELFEVLQRTPELFALVAAWLESVESGGVQVPFLDISAVVEQLRGVDSDSVVAFLQERQSAVASWLWSGVLGVGRGIGSFLTIVGYVALTPVLTYYLIRDWDRVTAAILELVPERRREGFVAFARESDRLVSGYLRGQVTVALAVGTITGVGLAIASFPYAATLGVVVAVFSVVPYLGLILSLIPAIVIALLSGSVGVSLLKVAVVYGVAQLLDGTVITPRIVGGSVGIHPVWVVLALTLGGFFFGFAGLLIAVPVAAVTKLLIVRGVERYRASAFFRGEVARPTA